MAIVGILRRGAGDPTFRRDPDGTLWRGVRTPDGPASLRLRARADLASVEATAWGAGAAWVLESVPSMLGADDDAEGFVAHHPQVALAARRFPGWRVPRTGRVIEALVPAILEQKVTGQEAFGSYRTLVRRYGAPAPGGGRGAGALGAARRRHLGADPVLGVADRERRRRPVAPRRSAPPPRRGGSRR